MGNRPTIGLVLAQAPGYSETFIRNKIGGLRTHGFRVVVFTDKSTRKGVFDRDEHVGFVLPRNSVFRLIKVGGVLGFLLLRCPIRFVRFCRLELGLGTSIGAIVRSLFSSAHILPFSLDVLHFGFATLGVGRENIGKAMGAKVSTSFRGYDISIFPLKRPNVYSKLWKVLDRVHTISDDLYSEALLLGLSASVPCFKIMPAIDSSKFVFRRKFDELNRSVKILTIARLQWKKGLEVALDSMAILKASGVSFEYTIVGSGSEHERLFFARHQLDLDSEVIFAGKRSHDEIAGLMREHTLYLQPSLQEGFCNSVLEAQASGLLCIVTDAEGLRENVLDEITGWVVTKWSPQSIAEKIQEVILLPTGRKVSISASAQDRVASTFTLEKQAQEFAKFFSSTGA